MAQQFMYDTNLAYHEPSSLEHPCTYNNDKPIDSQTMVFYPTLEEFSNFQNLVEDIEKAGAHLQSGIAKIVPPQEWHPRPSRKGDYSDVDMIQLRSPVEETFVTVGDSDKLYEKSNFTIRQSCTIQNYRTKALSREYANPDRDAPIGEVVETFWKNLGKGTSPIYGADQDGSIYDEGIKVFNMNSLGTCLDLLKEQNVDIKGVNTCYLYFGMYRTTFPWHAEDMDLYSVNYLHFGAPKFWYAISSEYAERFERLASQLFPLSSKQCEGFMRHKTFMIHPEILEKNNIPYSMMIQYPGEAIITFPKGYHMGFNTGYNLAESTNFALERWIDYGKNATICRCMKDRVTIDMNPFMEKYRPWEYEMWNNYWYGNITTQVAKPLDSIDVDLLRQLGCVRSMKKKSPDDTKWAYDFDMSLLWSDHGFNFNAEREFNQYRALQSPNCAVCQYFWPDKCSPQRDPSVPTISKRLVGNIMFAKKWDHEYCFVNGKIEDNMSEHEKSQIEEFRELFQCSECLVVVHKGCYTIGEHEKFEPDWKCIRCREPNEEVRERASCHLCRMRGGALMRGKKGRDHGLYVHVICALTNRLTWFPDPEGKTIALTQPPKKQNSINEIGSTFNSKADEGYRNPFPDQKAMRFYMEGLFECDLCRQPGEGLLVCMKCEEKRPALYHATCTKAAGLTLERRDWPIGIAMICKRDEDQFADMKHGMYTEINPGESVIAWINNGKVVQRGVVSEVNETTCCAVEFTDGTCSTDVSPRDITWCVCESINPNQVHSHILGAKVFVRWNDGTNYGGFFHGLGNVKIYTIDFGPGMQPLEMARDELYGPGDFIPDEVRRSLPPLSDREGSEQPAKQRKGVKRRQSSSPTPILKAAERGSSISA